MASWGNGWTLNAKTAGKHLYFNRDAANTSDVYIGRSGQELFVRGSDGNIGIGTTSPDTKLHLSVSGASPVSLLKLDSNLSSNADATQGIHLFKKLNNQLYGWKIESSGESDTTATLKVISSQAGSDNPRLTIARNTGNVGIGTTSPDSRLTINTNIAHDNNFNYGDAAVTIFDPTHNGGSTPVVARDILHLVREGVANQAFGNKVSFALSRYENNEFNSRTQLDFKLTDGNFDTHTPVMSLRSNGNVGIGTTTPSDRLDVNGNIKAPSATITSLNAEAITVSKRLSVTETLTVGSPTAPVGNPALNVAGVIQAKQMNGQAYRCEVPVLQFDGTDDYLDMGNSPALNPNDQSWTIELWFKCDRTSGENMLYNKENLYEAAVINGYFQYAWQPNWAWVQSFPVIAGEWYHVAVVYDLTKQQVYQNGSLVTSRSLINNIGTNTSKLLIAARGDNAPGSFFRGNIREFRIWNTARSAVEIQNFMNLSIIGNEAGLAAYWRINEGSGTQAKDDTTNQRHGTIQGATWSNMRSRITHDGIAFFGAQTFPDGEGAFIQQINQEINQAQRRILDTQTALDQAKRTTQTTQARINMFTTTITQTIAQHQTIAQQRLLMKVSFDGGSQEQINDLLASLQAAQNDLATAQIQLSLAQAAETQAAQNLQMALNDPALEALSYRVGLGQVDSLVYDSYRFHRWRTQGEEKMSLDNTGTLFVANKIGIGINNPSTKLEVAGGTTKLQQEDWISAPLANSWVNHSTEFNPAAYFKDSLGIVHLRGLVKSGSGTIFTLPVGYRPAYRELHCVQTYSNDSNLLNTAGRLDITNAGEVMMASGNNNWISLDGVTFRAAG